MCPVQFRRRILVFVQWGMEYLSFNRGARLVAGEMQRDRGAPSTGAAAPADAGSLGGLPGGMGVVIGLR